MERLRGDEFLAAHTGTAYRAPATHSSTTHVVIANMTRAEGRWTLLEAHGLYEHKSAAR
jgi:hypothetical protein